MSPLLSRTSTKPSIALRDSSSISGKISGLATGFGTVIRKKSMLDMFDDKRHRNFYFSRHIVVIVNLFFEVLI